MARLLLILALVVMAVAAGGGGWWFGVRGEPVPFLDSGSDSGSAKKKQASDDPVQFVEMDPISVPVMDEGQVVRILSVVVSVEVRQASTEIIDSHGRELRDAFIKQLHGMYSLDYVREHENRDKLVKQRLTRTARDIIGPAVKGIFFKEVNRRETAG
ncbi:Flagellar basal body-associated protein FliL [Limimonas halophila]|uniref:Flagellar basal body-associated protein FliL n=1 Tax=Limimonas halophila TaxID=1082479 RepID=A0A1G7NXA0_9PROT|nr:flagellar basal body-associated FliL family protein [Limimonas halophila]SDF77989.1 Flagellar basal body-associated protein FliL [Limimonas halophila]